MYFTNIIIKYDSKTISGSVSEKIYIILKITRLFVSSSHLNSGTISSNFGLNGDISIERLSSLGSRKH